MYKLRIKQLAVLAGFVTTYSLSGIGWAQSESSTADQEKETLVVTSTRTEKALSDIPATVSFIDAEEIERQLTNTISDLVRFEPGVSVAGGGRFGLSGFTIRGITDDRVLILVDKTPTADEFSFGPFLSSRRDFVDIDAIKSVEILRGPSSSSFGSNALGGIVHFVTKDPVDYLEGKSFAGSLKTSYASVDERANITATGAFGNEELSGMVVATLRDFSETESFFGDDNSTGPDRNAQNPQDSDSTNLFAKFVYAPSDTQKLTLVAESFDSETETDVLSVAGTFVRGVLTNQETGIDERERQRFSIDYEVDFESPIFDDVSLLAYTQSSDSSQSTFRERLSFTSGIEDRVRISNYQQDNDGLRLQFNKSLELGSSSHKITYGFDYDKAEAETRRDGFTTVRATGAPVFEFTAFPTRDFPLSELTSEGLFLQNDISLLDGRLNIIPSVRRDSFELSAEPDEIFLGGNPGSPLPEGYDESETSLRLGVRYDITDAWSAIAQYSEGFRAPPLDAVNVGFTNLAGGYTTLPNPNLKPESAEGLELGLRYESDALSFSAVAYQNDYTDFIETLSVRGFNFFTGLLEFQATNLDEAEISGFEMKLLADLGAIYPSLEGTVVRAAYASADGEESTTNTPINSIDPDQFVLGVAYAPSEKWGVEGILTLTDRKDASDIDASSLQVDGAPAVAPFESPGYGIVDLIGYYNFSDQLKLNWGVFNLTDKEYFSWSDELVQDPATTNFARLTQAG
ncbi:MAG: TonB-dependent hemoglobin/transferrin/lactoferrin family receptor, partial [Pseudomonadota bacterium]